jgi:hypothetical protein
MNFDIENITAQITSDQHEVPSERLLMMTANFSELTRKQSRSRRYAALAANLDGKANCVPRIWQWP